MSARDLYRIRCLVRPFLALWKGLFSGGGRRRSWTVLVSLAVLGWAACRWPESVRPLCLVVLLLLSSGMVFYLLYSLMCRTRYRIVAFAFLFVLGGCMYWLHPVDRQSSCNGHVCCACTNEVPAQGGACGEMAMLLEAADRTLSAFFPSRGGFESLPHDFDPRWYYLFHFLVLFYVGSILYAFFGRRQMDRFQWGFLYYEKDVNVFWDYSKRGEKLAQDLVRTSDTDQILFRVAKDRFRDDAMRGTIERLTRLDCMFDLSESAAVSHDDFVGPHVHAGHTLRRSELRGYRHFFIGDDARRNLSLLDAFVRSLADYDVGGNKQLYVRVNARDEGNLLASWADSLKPLCNGRAEIHIIHELSMLTRKFAEDYPVLNSLPEQAVDVRSGMVNGEFKLLVVGFDELGQALLKQEICDAQFKGLRFFADVVASVPDKLRYQEDFASELEAYPGIAFVEPQKLGSVFGRIAEYNRVIVCTGCPKEDLQVGMRIRRAYMDACLPLVDEQGGRKVFVYSPDGELADCLMRIRRGNASDKEDGNGTCPGIDLFGSRNELYSRRVIVDEALDAAAKRLNYVYVRKGKSIEEAWNDCSFFDKESSRASVLGERNLVRLLGYDIVDAAEEGAEDCSSEYRRRIDSPEILSLLAENEHLRWNAYHFTRGIFRWDVEGCPIPGAISGNQVLRYNRHAALVPYDALPDVEVALERMKTGGGKCSATREDFVGYGKNGGTYQSYDMDFVRNIPVVQGNAGKKIVRRKQVL